MPYWVYRLCTFHTKGFKHSGETGHARIQKFLSEGVQLNFDDRLILVYDGKVDPSTTKDH